MLFLKCLFIYFILTLNFNVFASPQSVFISPATNSSYSTIESTFPKNILPSTIYAEPYIYINYNLANVGYGNKLHSHLENAFPLGFGGAIGFYIQDLLMIEFGMSGHSAKIQGIDSLGVSGGTSTLIMNHLNLGLRIPLTKDYQIGFLILGGVAFGMLHNDYKISSATIPSNIPMTNFFIAPEFGAGLDFRVSQRISLRTDLKYIPLSSNNFIKNILRFSAGVSIKL